MSLQAPRTITSAVIAAATVASTAIAQNSGSAGPSRAPASSGSAPTALKQLDPADLAFWKNIRFTALSNDGKWFAYQLAPNEGDADVVVRPTPRRGAPVQDRRAACASGWIRPAVNTSVVLSDDAKWLAFLTYPTSAEAEASKDKKPVRAASCW
jgi:hypothetical protein